MLAKLSSRSDALKDLHSEDTYSLYNIVINPAGDGQQSVDFGVFNDLAGSGKTAGFNPLAQDEGVRQCQMGFDSMDGKSGGGLISPTGEMPNFQVGVSFDRKESDLNNLLEKPWDDL